MTVTSRFAFAFAIANALHCEQARTGNTIPYISHLMSVSALVWEYGGDEDQAIAALLHDAVEDQGGPRVAKVIRKHFGDRVADIVESCTDAAPEPGEDKAPWYERKRAYIDHLDHVSPDAALVVACDKIHNLTQTVADLERDGLETLDRFSQPESLAWYYRSVARALDGVAPPEPTARLNGLVKRFEELAA
jgi:(p)ppGpp synthase/HD superfamily hydrolase